jgi:hypothetical protein
MVPFIDFAGQTLAIDTEAEGGNDGGFALRIAVLLVCALLLGYGAML